jgi:hypothetical protein
MSFGLACGTLVAGWYLGGLPQTDRAAITAALHHTFLAPGGLALVSSLSFWTLRAGDGENVIRGIVTPVDDGAQDRQDFTGGLTEKPGIPGFSLFRCLGDPVLLSEVVNQSQRDIACLGVIAGGI